MKEGREREESNQTSQSQKMSKIKKTNKNILNTFQESYNYVLMTTRFNNKTWQENVEYRKRHSKIGCIYGSPEPISQSIGYDTIMFTLEMNNEENKIKGIGMVRNKAICEKYYIYENGNYNRYVYLGKYRIAREEMSEEEEKLMQAFDILCFTGKRHVKRGQGLRKFPMDMLYKCSKKIDILKYISNMFKKRMNTNEKNAQNEDNEKN